MIKRNRVQVYKKPGKSLTEQHHAKACDINTIMAKYLKDGLIDHISKYEPQFGDVSELDFKHSMDTITRVESEFHDLPAYVREHYDHDPANYLAAVITDDGLEELRNLKPPGQQYNRDGTIDQGEEQPQKAAEKPPEAAEGETGGVT